MLIEATQLHKSYNENVILDDVSFVVTPNSRIGLVGENGVGKTTLLKILQKTESFDDGFLHIKKGLRIVYVPQVPDIDVTETVSSFLSNYTDKPHIIIQALESLNANEIVHKKFGELSGGQKTKVYLARIALHEADVLLLDEPTNHLDMHGLDWLEKYIKQFKGALMLISHDRYFLDQVTTEIIELENGSLQSFGGNYSFYREQKQINKEAYAHQYQTQQKELGRLKNSANKQKEEGNRKNYNRVNTRDNDKYSAHYLADRSSNKLHNSAKNIESRMNHMNMLDKPDKEIVLDLYFRPSGAQNSNVIQIEDMDIAYTEPLLHVDSLSVLYGQRIALQGENGSGKTTLIRHILDHKKHEQIVVGPGVVIGYLSQDHAELLDNATAIDLLTEIEGIDVTAAYKILSQIKIDPKQAKQRTQDFSSGQKTKLLLALIMARGANCIILDEPTNHLDFEAIDVIESALVDFKGTLIVISHDRYFLEQIGVNKYISIKEKTLTHSRIEQ